MSVWFVVVAYLAAVNPPRIRPGFSNDPERSEPAPLVIGAAVVAGGGLALTAAGNAMLDALQITWETWQMAAGIVAVLAGARALVWPQLGDVPRFGGAAAGLVPVAFPLLLTPALAVLMVHFGATETLAFGLLVGGTGMCGDLLESILKRSGGHKDSSRMFPGYGGVLDVVDSVIISAPPAYLFLRLAAGLRMAG